MGLAFASPPFQKNLGSPLIVTRRLIMQKARHNRAISDGPRIFDFRLSIADLNSWRAPRASVQIHTSNILHRTSRWFLCASREGPALTPCKHIISGTISLRSQRFFSPFPRGTCSLSVANEYLGLRRGRRRFIRSFTCIVLLRKSLGVLGFSVTGLSPSMAQLSRSFT